MRAKLKPLAEQVIVITGASSGIGLATARAAAKAGAAVVLMARNEPALRQVADEINAAGGRAHAAAGDVGDADAVARVAQAAVARFGRFDTWVNDAGVGLYGELTEIPMTDHEALFRTNYFGVVNGSLEAARYLRAQPGGGAIINIGSILSDMAAPLSGAYTASKHAVKGFTDALRLELQGAGAPVSVTLIKPSSIATPFPQHAKNYMDEAPSLPPPLYAPEVVADAILHAAAHHVRQLTVGAGGRAPVLAEGLAPGLADRVFAALIPPLSRRGDAHRSTPRGRRFSVYTQAQKHRGLLSVGLLALAASAAWYGRGRMVAPRG